MTNEQDFQRILDKCPSDWQTKLILADWLDEQGDARAAGYREMGTLKLYPSYWSSMDEWYWSRGGKRSNHHFLNYRWYNNIKPSLRHHDGSMGYPSREEADNAAAIAYTRLLT